jgi:hypothetical protein
MSTSSTPACLNLFQLRHCHKHWQHTNMSQPFRTETLSQALAAHQHVSTCSNWDTVMSTGSTPTCLNLFQLALQTAKRYLNITNSRKLFMPHVVSLTKDHISRPQIIINIRTSNTDIKQSYYVIQNGVPKTTTHLIIQIAGFEFTYIKRQQQHDYWCTDIRCTHLTVNQLHTATFLLHQSCTAVTIEHNPQLKKGVNPEGNANEISTYAVFNHLIPYLRYNTVHVTIATKSGGG